jgi:1-deoxy-D-xylulose-5-phosphate reductoisomerase
VQKNITILGSTGSIGKQTLDIVRANKDKFRVIGLSAGKNIDLLLQQIHEFKPDYVSVLSENEKKVLLSYQGLPDIKVYCGEEGPRILAQTPETDMVVIAVVGIAGLIPTLDAIKANKTVALANKETLVAGGCLVMPEARKRNVNILPVDSEHSAIFQCLNSSSNKTVKRIIITASGGPFRTWEKDSIHNASFEQALKHPNWSMGQKVTIDSATLMNKALEIIEARWLFDLNYDQIEVLIHPQSIVHSMVEFVDGSVLAQMGHPTMHVPIQYALSYPDRIPSDLVKPLDLIKTSPLEFYEPDVQKFPALDLAYHAGKADGTYPAVMNAANEVAVKAYITSKISFYDIYKLVKECMNDHQNILNPTLENILEADRWARKNVNNRIASMILPT